MEHRPTFEQIYMNFALDLEERSTCNRKQVACVITSTDFRHVYGLGYNGNAEGEDNKCDHPEQQGACGCLHAEDNAVVNCTVPRQFEKVVFVTWSPCIMCAKRLVNLGNVKTLYYHREISSSAGIDLLEKHGIQTVKL